jgi:hypothetical protein
VGLVGTFLLDFSVNYKADHGDFMLKDPRRRKLPYLPWKASAERVREALESLEANLSPNDKVREDVRAIQNTMKPVLDKMHSYTKLDGEVDIKPLRDLVRPIYTRAQPNATVYANTPTPRLDLPKW